MAPSLDTPLPSLPTSSSFAPTKTRPDPCPAPSGDPAPPPPVVFPGPPAAKGKAQTRGHPRPPRPGLARPGSPSTSSHTHKTPLTPPGGGGGGGGSRVRENPTKWRRPLEPRRDRALSRAPPHARASVRWLSPPPRRSQATNPTAACKLFPQAQLPAAPTQGRGQLVTALRSGGQPAPASQSPPWKGEFGAHVSGGLRTQPLP